jgi:serine/threonine protein kinase
MNNITGDRGRLLMKLNDNSGFRTLGAGTILENNYKILSVLGDGGFGITYKGFDIRHNTEVAIKEYFPHEFAYRTMPSKEGPIDYTIYPLQSAQEAFANGKEHFLREATVLKNLEHLPSIVSVIDILKTNCTIYIVMEYIDGITLQNYVQNNGALSYQELLPLMLPIIKDLQQVHESGLIHRDISPDNLILGMDNQLHLIDFGSSTHFYSTGKHATTVFLKSGYAPPEQYLENGKQGPWVDVYGLCATMYMALTRIQPPDSLNRLQTAKLPALTENSDVPRNLSNIIEKGMSLKIADRYPSMTVLYEEITKHAKLHRTNKWFYLTAILIAGAGLVFLYCISHWAQQKTPVPSGGTVTEISEDANTTSENTRSTPEDTAPANVDTTEKKKRPEKATTETATKTTTETTTTATTEASTKTTTETTTQTKTKQTTQEKSTSSSYEVLPMEEDEYDVFSID